MPPRVFLSRLLSRARRIVVVLGVAGTSASWGAAGAQAPSTASSRSIGPYARTMIDRRLGLPEEQVNAIAQTPDGYLWFGTRRGLVRYDGLAFTVYSPETTRAFTSNWVNGLYVDRAGQLWVATRRGLVVRSDTGFRRVDSANLSPEGTWDVVEDRQGRYWVATEDGVWRGDGARFAPVAGARVYTYAVAVDSTGRVWMAGREFLGMSDGDTVVDRSRLVRDRRRVFDVMVMDGNHVWVATRSGATELLSVAGREPTVIREVSTKLAWRERPVWVLGRTRDGAVWFGTEGSGLLMWDGESLHDLGPSPRETWSLFSDARGVLWAGTNNGVEQLQPTAFELLRSGLPSLSVWAARADERGDVWVALSDGSVYRWSAGRFVQRVGGRPGVLSSPIWPVPGGMLVAPATRPLTIATATATRPLSLTGLPAGDVLGIFRARDGSLWFSVDSGLFVARSGHAVDVGTTLGYRRGERPREIVQDSAGRLYFGRPDLRVLDGTRVRHYGAADGLTDPVVRSIYPRGENVWLGTADSGLFVLRDGRIRSLGAIDRRLHRDVLAIAEDDMGDFWLMGSYDLTRVPRVDLERAAAGERVAMRIQTFDQDHGIPGVPLLSDFQSAIHRDAAGRLWFPSGEGVVRVDPRQLRTETILPQARLETLVVDGKPAGLGNALVFPAGVARVEFTFAATNAAVPRHARVQFRLVGLDTTWTDAGLRRNAAFGPLRGGAYRFEVRAAGEDGPWSRAATSAFEVRLSLTEHRWFVPLLFVITIGAVVGVARWRQHALERRSHQLSQLVRERTEALESARESLERRVAERTAQLAGELEERKRLEQQLLQAQKLESLGRLAGGVAHEINNSMTGVLGFAELAALGAAGNPELLANLDEVRHAGERVASITRQLLAFARQRHSAFEDIDTAELLQGLSRSLQHAAGPRTVDIVLGANVPFLRADRVQVEQVLINLVVNARDATSEGSVIRVRAGTERLSSPRTIGGTPLRPGLYVVLSVSDQGAGISAEDQARLFEPFFTTKEYSTGTGLGLAVCHGIVVQHQGAIGVHSSTGVGTTFEVWLPGVHPTAPATTETLPPAPVGDETILLVDDEPVVRQVTRLLLESAGYTVLEASDGAEALEAATGQLDRIDLVVTDVIMPRLDGLEFARRMRLVSPDLPIVFISGFSGHQGTAAERLAGLGPLLTKPFTRDDLSKLVRRELDRSPRRRPMAGR